MAVVVKWDDGTEARWDTAVRWAQASHREPFYLYDDKGSPVTVVPDFGVRYVAYVSPNEVTEPERGPNHLAFGRLRETE